MLNAEALLHREGEAAGKAPRPRVFLLHNGHREIQHSSPEATRFMGFIAARVTARIFAAAIREGQIFCAPKSP